LIKTKTKTKRRIHQGDIIKDVEYIEWAVEKGDDIEVSKLLFPNVYILSQDCDLEQDYKNRNSKEENSQDKYLLSVLVAPVYNAEKVYAGQHMNELEMNMSPINKNKTPGKNIQKNTNPRYHYLEFHDNSMVPSVIDFKHYFSVNTNYLRGIKKTNYFCTVSELFREDISLRFSNYLARIGLPNIKTI